MPGDVEGRPLVLELPDIVGKSGTRLMTVSEVALVLGDPVPHSAVSEAGVGLLGALCQKGTYIYLGEFAKVQNIFAGNDDQKTFGLTCFFEYIFSYFLSNLDVGPKGGKLILPFK